MVIVDRMAPEGGNQATSQFHAEAARLRSAAEVLDNARQRRSPLETPAAHAVKVAKAARKFGTEATAGLNRVIALSGRAQAELQKRIDEKANLIPNEFAKEIRERFHGMKKGDQGKQIEQWLDQGKGPEMAAILRAPSMLTGLNDDQKARYEQAFVAKHASDLLAEQASVSEVFDSYLAADRAATDLVRSLTDPRQLAEIERGAEEADAAWAACDQTLSGNVSTGA